MNRPFCKDCRFIGQPIKENSRCMHPDAIRKVTDIVTGQNLEYRLSCSSMRLSLDSACGEEAKLFEPRSIGFVDE